MKRKDVEGIQCSSKFALFITICKCSFKETEQFALKEETQRYFKIRYTYR